MACTIKTPSVSEQRDFFKKIKNDSRFKKAEAKLTDILSNGIDVDKLMAEQKANGKKNFITRTIVGSGDNVLLPLDYVEVKEVKVMSPSSNFYSNKNKGFTDGWSVGEDEKANPVVYVKKAGKIFNYKKIKVTYTKEDDAERKDLRGDAADLKKAAAALKGIQSGDTSAAQKFLDEKIKQFKDNFDGVFDGTSTVIDKILKDANIPPKATDAVIVVDKVKYHKGSNVINLEKATFVKKVQARKKGTDFFFNVVQYKFLKDNSSIIADNLYEEYKVEYKGEGSATSEAAEKGATTGDFPTVQNILDDVGSAFASVGGVVGNVASEINSAASQFGKDINSLLGAAQSGDLLNTALANANKEPAVYTVETTVRDDAGTNAIALPDLAGGSDGVIEVLTKQEGNNFFSKMNKSDKFGWRVEGTDLYMYEIRAAVKVKYKKEIDPPVAEGVPQIDPTENTPLDTCTLPAMGVKIVTEEFKNPVTGKTEQKVIKNKENKPQVKKQPVTKAESENNVAESPTIANAQATASSSGFVKEPTETVLVEFDSFRDEWKNRLNTFLDIKDEEWLPSWREFKAGPQYPLSTRFPKEPRSRRGVRQSIIYYEEGFGSLEERAAIEEMIYQIGIKRAYSRFGSDMKTLIRDYAIPYARDQYLGVRSPAAESRYKAQLFVLEDTNYKVPVRVSGSLPVTDRYDLLPDGVGIWNKKGFKDSTQFANNTVDFLIENMKVYDRKILYQDSTVDNLKFGGLGRPAFS